jgi:putative restriction endonuclease
LLTPDADLLFDRGFITFQDDGEVTVSSRADKHDLRRLGFDQLVRKTFGVSEAPILWRTQNFGAHQSAYLAYHRTEVFVS